jgi:hypothetical protein
VQPELALGYQTEPKRLPPSSDSEYMTEAIDESFCSGIQEDNRMVAGQTVSFLTEKVAHAYATS